MQVIIGSDIGQSVDPTTIVVSELQWRPVPKEVKSVYGYEEHYVIRKIISLPLGTKYPDIARELIERITNVENAVMDSSLGITVGELRPTEYAQVTTYIDATGVGQPVVDLVRAAGIKVTGVYFNHGDRYVMQKDPVSGDIRTVLGKAYMVARLQALLQTHRMHLPNTYEARLLAEELLAYEIRVDENANDRYGAFKVGKHDDLVTALGLTAFKPPQRIGTVSSAPGVIPVTVPNWAGGDDKSTLTKDWQLTSLGNKLNALGAPRVRNAWGHDGSNGTKYLRRR